MLSHSIILPISIEKVWKYLLIKIKHPENFVPSVSDVEILNEENNAVIRAMHIEIPNTPKFRFVEKITWDPYLIKFEIIEHPIHSGYVENLAEIISENETKITFTLNWKNKQTEKNIIQQEIITNAVNKTAAYILEKEGITNK